MSFYPHKEEVEMELYPPRAVERTMKVQEIIHENQTSFSDTIPNTAKVTD